MIDDFLWWRLAVPCARVERALPAQARRTPFARVAHAETRELLASVGAARHASNADAHAAIAMSRSGRLGRRAQLRFTPSHRRCACGR
ncbi:MAG TPA: hypothetical protein VGH09_10335 [Solirubrobacteraceae bacterium]